MTFAIPDVAVTINPSNMQDDIVDLFNTRGGWLSAIDLQAHLRKYREAFEDEQAYDRRVSNVLGMMWRRGKLLRTRSMTVGKNDGSRYCYGLPDAVDIRTSDEVVTVVQREGLTITDDGTCVIIVAGNQRITIETALV